MPINIRIRLFWLVLAISCLPFLLNFLGIDFASQAIRLDAEKMANGSISADDQFYALKGAMHHALLEWSAVSIAVFATLTTFLHYYRNKDITVPIIGVALLCAGFTDAFHTLAATRIISASSPNADFIPFTWAFSRIFNASVMALGIILSLWLMRKTSMAKRSRILSHSPKILLAVSIAFVSIALLLMLLAASSQSLPRTMFPEALISRPYDVVPLAMFTFVAALAWSWYKTSPSIIKYGLLLSLIPEVVTQLHMSFGSIALFDNHFNIAHALKIFAYACILFAALFDLLKSTSVTQLGDISNSDDAVVNSLTNSQPVAGLLKIGSASRPLAIMIPVAAFFLSLIITVLVSSLFYIDNKRMASSQKIEELRVQSKLVDSLLLRFYKNSLGDAQFLSRTPPIQGIIKSINKNDSVNYALWKDRLETIFSEMLLSSENYLKIRYISTADQGKELVNVQLQDKTVIRVPQSKFQKTKSMGFYERTLKLLPGQVYFSKIELKREQGEVTTPHQAQLRIATPVYDQLSGEVFGIVIINSDFSSFVHKLKEESLTDINLYISNENGDFIYHPQVDKTFGFDLGFKATMQQKFPSLASRINAGIKQLTYLNAGGAEAGYYSIINLRKYDVSHVMRLMLTYDKKIISEQVEDFRNRGLLLGLALAVMALSLAVLVSRRLTLPLIQTTQAIEHYDNTGVLLNLPVDSKDEVGVLARSINNMVMQKQQRDSELQEMKFALDQHAIVSITDVKGAITLVNDKFLEVSGYNRDELLGANHRILNSGYHAKVFFKAMYKTIASGKVWRNEICNKAKDGHYYWVDSTMVPLMDEHGKLKSYISIRADISARKQMELELLESKDKALGAVKAKSEFLASMSHEIRTPMNGILGMLGLLMNSKLDKDQLHRVKIAQSSGQALLTLINDILDFSKIEAGKLELEMVDFNLRDMLGEFAETMALTAQAKGLELVLDVMRVEESMVRGDPSRLRQILINLVGNAIKFTAQGEIVITAESKLHKDDKFDVLFSVEDTGIGIPENKIFSLFDSFSQVDTSTTRKYGGTGLGLAIAKKLCSLMGGDIAVKSIKDKGSVFSFSVILDKSHQSKQLVPSINIENLRLLIVDDNETNCKALRDQLEHWGASVTEAHSGKQALKICKQQIESMDGFFDIAFLDMQMPDMDGEALGRAIVLDDQFKKMKLVMMTSMGFQYDIEKYEKIGFSTHFPKPAITSDLFNALAIVSQEVSAIKNSELVSTGDYQHVSPYEEHSSVDFNWPKNTRILLVEDNHVNQLVAQGVLNGFGLQAEVANDGVDALSRLKKSNDIEPFTLIFMDCQMPEMDGYDATRLIRSGKAGDAYISIPIIAMTANAMAGDKEKCLAVGMNDYLSKPLSNEELLKKLYQWLPNLKEAEVADVESDKNMSNIDKSVWDREDALHRLLGKEDLLKTVIEIIIAEMPVRMQELKQAIDANNYEAVSSCAHSIKGVVANISGLELQKISEDMERSARNNEKDKVQELFPKLVEASESLLRELEKN